MDRIGLTGAGNNITSIKAQGSHTVMITLKTSDSQFIAAILNRAVRRPAAHLVEGEGSCDVHELEPGRLRPVQRDHPLHDAGLRLRARTRTTGRPGLPKIACLEYVQAASNDAALALIQSGQVDWTHNFVPNVEKAYEAKDPAHFHALLRDDRVSDLAHLRRHAVPVQPGRLPQGAQPRDRPQLGLEARRVRLRAADRRDRPQRALPEVGHRQVGEGAGEVDGDVQPGGREDDAHERRLHVQGQPAASTRRATPSSSTST